VIPPLSTDTSLQLWGHLYFVSTLNSSVSSLVIVLQILHRTVCSADLKAETSLVHLAKFYQIVGSVGAKTALGGSHVLP
jgi:hypothetical protein